MVFASPESDISDGARGVESGLERLVRKENSIDIAGLLSSLLSPLI
jgi:hypothetical protein